MKDKFVGKHSNPDIMRKIVLIVFSLFLISFAYPCLNSTLPKGFNFPCFFFESTWVFYVIAAIIVLMFILIFIADNWKKIPYYLSEFFLIIFGIYGVVILQKAFQNQISFKFTLFNVILIFIISAILLDFREIFKDLLDET